MILHVRRDARRRHDKDVVDEVSVHVESDVERVGGPHHNVIGEMEGLAVPVPDLNDVAAADISKQVVLDVERLATTAELDAERPSTRPTTAGHDAVVPNLRSAVERVHAVGPPDIRLHEDVVAGDRAVGVPAVDTVDAVDLAIRGRDIDSMDGIAGDVRLGRVDVDGVARPFSISGLDEAHFTVAQGWMSGRASNHVDGARAARGGDVTLELDGEAVHYRLVGDDHASVVGRVADDDAFASTRPLHGDVLSDAQRLVVRPRPHLHDIAIHRRVDGVLDAGVGGAAVGGDVQGGRQGPTG